MDNEEVSHIIESLIRMVGKANQNVDSLQRRVSQLEWLIRRQQFEESLQKVPAQNS